MPEEYTGSRAGTVANFISSTASTLGSISESKDNKIKSYKCGRCGQPIAKFQKKCHNCGAILGWEGVD